MAGIFVSYSRKNIDFCKKLTAELQKRDFDFWVDWEGIPPTVDWLKEIEKGIEEANTFIAIVSAEWISSPICMKELELAVKNGKRLIPVVPYEIVWNDVPPALSKLNFIFFTEKFDFNQQLTTLFTALDTDYEWLKIQSRLQVKGLEWERGNKDVGFLLRGTDLVEAERHISVNANKDPHPTDLQYEYIQNSRQETDKQRRRTTIILGALVVVLFGIITLIAKPYVKEAIAKFNAKEQSQLVSIPAGSVALQMDIGAPSKTFDLQAFNIEVHAVTNSAYNLCVSVNKCALPIGSAERAESQLQDDSVVMVTIVQAEVYCNWIGRRLPDAAEWEYAVHTDGFTISNYFEWTSSYLTNDMQTILGKWNGKLDSLNLDWPFLQQAGVLSSDGVLSIYKNHLGAFGANPDLGFRCVEK